jgi:tryptophan 2,3-dioxygenase
VSDKLTYGSYLKIDELLSIQQPLSDPPHHDEMLFIVIHQVYELWFKLLLHEIEAAMRFLAADDLLKVQKNFRRIHAIQQVLEHQIDVLETMTPQEFNAFRDGLDPASGFQSAQFREIEFLCGAQKTGYLRFLEPTGREREVLERRLASPTLHDALLGLLAKRGYRVEPHEALIESLKTIYDDAEKRYDLYLLLEDFIEFDERFLLWRGRHVRMVERMIGLKPGTGGSLGVAYLEKTLSKKFFPELWEVRTHLGTARPYGVLSESASTPAERGGPSTA